MEWQYALRIFPLLITGILSARLGYYAWRRRPAAGALPFAILMLGVSEWGLVNVLERAAADLVVKIFWANVEHLSIATVPVLWLVFVLDYVGQARWLTRRNLIALFIIPLLTLVFVWTNDAHGLMRGNIQLDTSGPVSVITKTDGPWFWVHTAYSYGMLLTGTVLLVQKLAYSSRLYQGQRIVLLVSAFLPWVGNILYIFHLDPTPFLDLTPIAFALSGLAITAGIFRF